MTKAAKSRGAAKKKALGKVAALVKPDDDRDENITQVLMAMEEGQSLREACGHIGVAPSSFIRWVEGDDELAEHYARARERLLDVKAEELEEIGERAAQAKTAVEVAGLRLLSDNRKWLLSKLAPKKYGDKTTIAGDQENPLAVLTMEQIAANPRSRIGVA